MDRESRVELLEQQAQSVKDSNPTQQQIEAAGAHQQWHLDNERRAAQSKADREAKTVYPAKGPIVGAILIANLITALVGAALYALLK